MLAGMLRRGFCLAIDTDTSQRYGPRDALAEIYLQTKRVMPNLAA